MKQPSEFPEKNTACLYSIGSSTKLLLLLAKHYPDEKDVVMTLIIEEKNILKKSSINEHSHTKLYDLYQLCRAYPNHKYDILKQTLSGYETKLTENFGDFGMSEPAQLFCCLFYGLAEHHLHAHQEYLVDYQECVNFFFEAADEFFQQLINNDAFFQKFTEYSKAMIKVFSGIEPFHNDLVETLLRQPDQYWLDKIDQVAKFYYLLKNSKAHCDRLCARYFSTPNLYQRTFHFETEHSAAAQLLNLALDPDYSGRNDFGIDIFLLLFDFFKELGPIFIELLNNHPEAAKLLGINKPFSFYRIVDAMPEHKEALLSILTKQLTSNELLCFLTHGEEIFQPWGFCFEELEYITKHFPEHAQRIITFLSAPENASKLPIMIGNFEQPEASRIMSYAARFPALKSTLTNVLKHHYIDCNKDFDAQAYQGVFPEHLWPWIELVKTCDAPHQTPPLTQHQLMLEFFGAPVTPYRAPIKALCELFTDEAPTLLAYFPEPPPKTIEQEIAINPTRSIDELCQIVLTNDDSPDRLLNLLRSEPTLRKAIFLQADKLYALFLLLPNRKELFSLFDFGHLVLKTTIEKTQLTHLTDAIIHLPNLVPYVIKALFEQPDFFQAVCADDQAIKHFIQLTGHQAQIIPYFCQSQQILDQIFEFICRREQEIEIPRAWFEVIVLGHIMFSCAVKNGQIDLLQEGMDAFSIQQTEIPFGPEHIRCVAALLKNMTTPLEPDSDMHQALEQCHGILLSRAMPSLTLFCVNALNTQGKAPLDINILPERTQPMFLLPSK